MKLGLKLWSNNTDAYLNEAKKLYSQKVFDYIELYVVPNTLETIIKWKKLSQELNIPFTLHAPHFIHGVNLAKTEYKKNNAEIFEQVNKFSTELNVEYVVVHSGIEGNIDETIRQLKIINLPKMLIENKPYCSPSGLPIQCRGATIGEITKVMNEIGCGFCLDISHAICTYNTLKKQTLVQSSHLTNDLKDPYEFLAQFNALKPICYHLSDGFIDGELDKHLHFGQGNYDFKNILAIIDTNKNMAIETNKDSNENLNDFILDVSKIKEIKDGIY